jgi:hypothetical protein
MVNFDQGFQIRYNGPGTSEGAAARLRDTLTKNGIACSVVSEPGAHLTECSYLYTGRSHELFRLAQAITQTNLDLQANQEFHNTAAQQLTSQINRQLKKAAQTQVIDFSA